MSRKRPIVVFGSDWDVYQYAFQDWIENEKITYISSFHTSGILGFAQRVHYNPAINKKIWLPGKPLWNHRFDKISTAGSPCFIILENWLRLESGIQLLPYLRTRYPEAKIVCFLQDLVERTVDMYTGRVIDIDRIKQQSDLVITYDPQEAKRYELCYSHTVYSPLRVEKETNLPSCDIYFLGANKGRLPLLVELANTITAAGKQCAFYISDCSQEEQVQQEGIHYCSEPMSYAENLSHVMNAKCILEIVQNGAESATFRTWEAISLGKKLYTNNANILQWPAEMRTNIHYFRNAHDIDLTFIDREIDQQLLKTMSEQIRPESLLVKIEEELKCELIR